jgi:hypothetical protein
MISWSLIASALMLAGAGSLAWMHAGQDPAAVEPPSSAPGRLAAKILNFFGIGRISLGLAGAVWLSTAAVTGAALDILAVLSLGAAYPAWFPLNAMLAGLAVGLGCTWIVAATPPRQP